MKTDSRLADIQSQLARVQFSAIGGIQRSEVNGDFFIGRATNENYHRPGYNFPAILGPQFCSHDWVQVRLAEVARLLDETISGFPAAEAGDVVAQHFAKELARDKTQVEAILPFLPGCYSPSLPESTSLYHWDLHADNIFIDDNDTITAVLDWELLIAVPEWSAMEFPKFLRTKHRKRAPVRDDYGEVEDWLEEEEKSDAMGCNRSYWKAQGEWEATQLRTFYLAEMDRMSPGWADRHRATKFHRVLEQQILFLEYGGWNGDVRGWLEAYQGDGQVPKEGRMDSKWPTLQEDTPCDAELYDE
jgi:hypothetical protein